jgi:glucose/mannose-6-phosphate isomerase
MLELLKKFPKQIEKARNSAKNIKVKNFNKILVCGMGGSGIPGEILKNYLKHSSKIPIITNKSYSIPKFVDSKTLVFIVSYSGNTEETLSAFEKARQKKAKIVSITSNGRLKKLDKNCIKIPEGFEPRAALGYLFFPMLKVLENSKVIKNQSKYIKETIKILKRFKTEKAKQLAKRLYKKRIIVYGSERYKSVVLRWKNQLNENSKELVLHNTFSEINHNEIEAYAYLNKSYSVVIIRDKKDFKRIRKTEKITINLIKKKVNTEEVWVKGKSLLAKLFYAIHFGECVSYYLSTLNKVDPNKIPLIDKIKEKLK